MTEMGERKQIFASVSELRNVLMHIEQDRAEKVEEIEVKCEEEFEAEKYREIMNQVHFIELHYDERENRVRKKMMVEYISLKNASRMKQLKIRHEHILEIIEEVKNRIRSSAGKQKYKEMISLLLLEGLFKMVEPYVKVLCLQQDKPLIQDVINKITSEYTQISGTRTEIVIDNHISIGPETEGGVVLVNKNDTISLCNTVNSRLERIFTSLQPFIHSVLYQGRKTSYKNTEIYSKPTMTKEEPSTSTYSTATSYESFQQDS